MDIILSIKPQYAEKIASGIKRIEFRKQIPNQFNPGKTAYIYATAPVKKIIGFFTIGNIKYNIIDNLWDLCGQDGGITRDEFYTYFRNYRKGYAIKIFNVCIYDTPHNPHDMFDKFKPPRNFCYARRTPKQTAII